MVLESLLSSTSARDKASSSFVLFQSTLATPWVPIARSILFKVWSNSKAPFVCLFCLYPPADILPNQLLADKRVIVIDWTNDIPGYTSSAISWQDNVEKVIQTLRLDETTPLTLFVDSPDTLSENINAGSPSMTYKVLKQWLAELLKRPSPSRLITHIPATSPLLPLVLPPSFSPSLMHVVLHPQVFIAHLIESYFAYPPSHPQHSPGKFWPLFTGISTRTSGNEVEAMVWGSEGNGWANNEMEKGDMVLEVTLRHPGGRQTVERTLQGWLGNGQLVELADLPGLKSLWKNGRVLTTSDAVLTQGPDPTRDLNLPFNLTLSDKQQSERAQIPLPYAHDGNSAASTIYYDPDSADDIDEDDPDEDLDI